MSDDGASRGLSRAGRPILVLAIAAAGLLGTACGGGASAGNSNPQTAGGSAGTTVPPVGSGYLASASNFVDFVQWNDDNGNLTGSAQSVDASGQAPNLTTTNRTLVVTGTLNGSSLSLSFDGAALTFGTLSGGSFTMNFPQPGGTLAPLTFQSASATEFNDDVAKLGRQITQANQTVARATQITKEQHAIDSDISTVNADIASVSDQSSLTKSVASTQSSRQQVATDLATTQAKLQQVANEAASGDQTQTCYDASQSVAYQASQSVAYDTSQGVEYNASQGVEYDASTLRTGITRLQQDFSQLESDEGTLPSYSPSGAPTQTQVDQATGAATVAISSAVATANSFIDQANADVATAFQYVAQAYQAGGCGMAPAQPAPVGHIS